MDGALLATASTTFETSAQSSALGRTFSKDFASRKLEMELKLLEIPSRSLPSAWETCVKSAIPARAAVEEEITTAKHGHVRLTLRDTNLILISSHRQNT